MSEGQNYVQVSDIQNYTNEDPKIQTFVPDLLDNMVASMAALLALP